MNQKTRQGRSDKPEEEENRELEEKYKRSRDTGGGTIMGLLVK